MAKKRQRPDHHWGRGRGPRYDIDTGFGGYG